MSRRSQGIVLELASAATALSGRVNANQQSPVTAKVEK